MNRNCAKGAEMEPKLKKLFPCLCFKFVAYFLLGKIKLFPGVPSPVIWGTELRIGEENSNCFMNKLN